MTPSRPRFYSNSESIARAAAALVHRHGSPEAAIAAIKPACVRMHQRTLACARTPADWRRIDAEASRSGWRNAVRIELLKLVRYQIPQPQPRCPRCQGASQFRDAHRRWRPCHVCAGGGDPAFPAPGVQAEVSVPDGYRGPLRHIYCPECSGVRCRHCKGIGYLAVPTGGGL
jgi:hypothetical protein